MNWNKVKLSEVTTILGDGLHGTPTYDPDGEYYFINGSNLLNGKIVTSDKDKKVSYQEYLKHKKNLNDRTILVSINGTLGNVAIYNNEKVILGKSACYFNVKENTDKLFIKYVISSPFFKEYIHNLSTGTTIKNVSLKLMRDFEFYLPNLYIQKKISNILGTLDNKIDLNTQINQTLEQIAQALFKSWFIDFDPVRAKVQALSDGLSLEQAELAAMQAISGKTPEELTALSQTQPDRYAELAETAKAFPCEMVEVDGVEVPKGWEMKALSDLGQIICGKTPSKSNKEFYGNEVPFIKIPDMHNQAFITQTTDNLSLSGANSQSKKYIPPKSICVSCIATVGLVSMISKPSHTNQQINSIIPNDEQTSEFLYLSLKQPSMTKYLKDLASGGSATLNLNTSTFSKIEIMTPSKEIIDIFHNKVVYAFEKVLSNSIENKRLAEIRDLLLPNLLNGESDE